MTGERINNTFSKKFPWSRSRGPFKSYRKWLSMTSYAPSPTGMLSILALCMVLLPTPTLATQYDFVHCEDTCNQSLCPVLVYCEGVALKDSCNCCDVCSDDRYQPHAVAPNVPPKGGEACKQVKCPKFKICSENMQGLPLCKCPSTFFCRKKKKREICATNGETYASRCHMRIASCNLGEAIRKKYRGACSPEKDRKYRRRKLKERRRPGRDDDSERVDVDERDPGISRRRTNRKNAARGERKKRRNRKRRKISDRRSRGKRRTRRHRRNHHNIDAAGRAFEEAFAHYTWSKK